MLGFQDSGTDTKKYGIIAGIIIVLTIIVILWIRYRKPKDVIVVGPIDIGTAEVQQKCDRDSSFQKWRPLLDADQQIRASGNNITCSFFFFVKDLLSERIPIQDPDKLQYFFSISNVIGIKYNPITQECVIDIQQTPPHTDHTDQMKQKEVSLRTMTVPNVYTSKWNQMTVTVEGRTIDVFINGRLATSALLDNVPIASFSGVSLNLSPDFTGQAALIQVWPERKTSSEILHNYQINTDTRGRPIVPEPSLKIGFVLERMKNTFCKSTGMCGLSAMSDTPLDYVEYEFA
jgi:hypothetical protein